MASVTLATLRARVRERADMAGSSFVADDATGLDAWINEAHQKLHGMLVDALGEEYIESINNITTTGADSYALPADFYKLYAAGIIIGNRVRKMYQFSRGEQYRYLGNPNAQIPRYRVVNRTLRLAPNTGAGQVLYLSYAPNATTLAVAGDTVDYPNGWDRFIVLDAAIQALLKEESSVTALAAERDRVVREIETTKEQRDLANPHRVTDVHLADYEFDDEYVE